MSDNMQQHFDGMTPHQKHILAKMHSKIMSCEGKGMPYKYWCRSCTSLSKRTHELFIRFERMNTNRLQLYEYTSSTHPGYADEWLKGNQDDFIE